ncbi:MerR family transcriptional regulator [Deinococcus sp.]|uniref:MerR family transcriptional regulator n=1 Tax=Deinococcus sp. TaxID=47478 RepID=UPI003CC5E12B
MRIGELAAASGVSVRSLRYYEERGLLSSTRSDSGQRHYGDAAAARVLLIQQLYSAGLSSKVILGLLPCIETPVEKYTPLVLARLVQERDRIDAQVTELVQARDKLESVIGAAATTPYSGLNLPPKERRSVRRQGSSVT